MNLIRKDIKNFGTLLFSAMLAIALSACSASDPEESDVYSTPLNVTAQMAETISTRDYLDSGEVTEGTYYISYPAVSTLEYNLATVNFDLAVTPGIGVVIMPNNQEMRWENVGGNMPTFYLDNVVPTETEPEDQMIVNFTNGGAYKAAVFDDRNGSNDLLWGSLQVYNNTRTLNFSLHHNMARLRVEVSVDKTFEIDDDLNLEGATVKLSSINQQPLSYDRQTGLFTLSTETSAYTPLTLVNSSAGLNWVSEEPDPDNENLKVYTTPDFVLPPQDLLTDDNRPRLTIELANGRKFSGIVPYAMNVVDSDHPTAYPMTLSFLKEHVLTLHTLISNDPPTLSFMPVKVVEWVDKGTFDIDGHQAGIYRATEFYSLIGYYNAENEFQLYRYGNLTNSVWVFNLWSSIDLDYSQVFGMMRQGGNKLGYSFKYNGYGVTLTQGNVTKEVSATDLVSVLSGTLTFDQI